MQKQRGTGPRRLTEKRHYFITFSCWKKQEAQDENESDPTSGIYTIHGQLIGFCERPCSCGRGPETSLRERWTTSSLDYENQIHENQDARLYTVLCVYDLCDDFESLKNKQERYRSSFGVKALMRKNNRIFHSCVIKYWSFPCLILSCYELV